MMRADGRSLVKYNLYSGNRIASSHFAPSVPRGGIPSGTVTFQASAPSPGHRSARVNKGGELTAEGWGLFAEDLPSALNYIKITYLSPETASLIGAPSDGTARSSYI
ncbi:unnamed protein product, partial [Iphiclides podalirius]